MKVIIIISVILVSCIIAHGQVKEYDDYKIVHPQWSIGDSILFEGQIITTGIEEGDSLHSTMEVVYTMIVEQKDSLGNYTIKCNSDSGDIRSNIKELGLVAEELSQLDIPPTKLIVNKWGYATSISNIEELESSFQNFFGRILKRHEENGNKQQLQRVEAYLNQYKGEKLELSLIQSLTAVFMHYDKIFKMNSTIDSSYTYIANENEPTLIVQEMTLSEGESTLTVSTNINYALSENQDSQQFKIDKMVETQTMVIDKATTWLRNLTIKINQKIGNSRIDTEIRYNVKNNSM